MRVQEDYRILQSGDLQYLVNTTNQKLAEGYLCAGGICVNNVGITVTYYQAIVKHVPGDIN